jgi:hypothetical protein
MNPNLSDLLTALELTPAELAGEACLSVATVNNILAGQAPGQEAKHKIEAALNQPIWSTPQEFSARKYLRDLLGKDPAFLTIKVIRERARARGLRVTSTMFSDKESLIKTILKASAEQAAFWQELERDAPRFKAEAEADLRIFRTATKWRCHHCGHVFSPTTRSGKPRIPGQCPNCHRRRVLPDDLRMPGVPSASH